jgi:predicted nucleotidyltransferase
LPSLGLRDRDAIITNEGLIFRVLGYSHPSNAYICDAEYAPAKHFKSENPKALRTKNRHVFYKFYEDEAWEFLQDKFPKYLIFHDMLCKKTIGVNLDDVFELRKPDKEFARLINRKPNDVLIVALHDAFRLLMRQSGLTAKNFGVFGSILHGFHHPHLSDLDFTVYGRRNVVQLRETLQDLQSDKTSLFMNEFETDESIRGKQWHFKNFTQKEFAWHQRRKLIYSLFRDEKTSRIIKTEFEPVKDWKEINNEYDPRTRIVQKGWVEMFARVTKDDDAPFMPSIYHVKPLKVLEGARCADEATRIVSYMEEFRMQVFRDETIYVEGNLEEVRTSSERSFQISLTYCPRYYEQVLMVSPQDQLMPRS